MKLAVGVNIIHDDNRQTVDYATAADLSSPMALGEFLFRIAARVQQDFTDSDPFLSVTIGIEGEGMERPTTPSLTVIHGGKGDPHGRAS